MNKYPTFFQDARSIRLPSPSRVARLSLSIIVSSCCFGAFFVGMGRLVSMGLALLQH